MTKKIDLEVNRAKARRLWAGGMAVEKIAETCGVGRRQIYRWKEMDAETIHDWDDLKIRAVGVPDKVLTKTQQEKVIEQSAIDQNKDVIEEMIAKRREMTSRYGEAFKMVHNLAMGQWRPVMGPDGKPVMAANGKPVFAPNTDELDALEQTQKILKENFMLERKNLGVTDAPVTMIQGGSKENAHNVPQTFQERMKQLHAERGHTPTDSKIVNIMGKTGS